MEYLKFIEHPAIIQVLKQRQVCELNFANEKSMEERELAYQDLSAAKELSKVSKAFDGSEISIKKALNRKAKQSAMEATEHAQKSVTFADDRHMYFGNSDLYYKLEKTHNNIFVQREQAKVGINILEKEDIRKLNSNIKKRAREKSDYNAIRFINQEIDDKSVDDAIMVSEKAIKNLEKKVKESKKFKIIFGNEEIYIESNGGI